jgi:hypothetical protein
MFGGFLYSFGWFVGVALLWTSKRWSTRDKLIGTFVLPGGLAAAIVGALFAASGGSTRACSGSVGEPQICSSSGSSWSWVGSVVLAACILAPFFTAFYLRYRAHQVRPANWVPRQSSSSGCVWGIAALAIGILALGIGLFAVSGTGVSNGPAQVPNPAPPVATAEPVQQPTGPLPTNSS